MINILMGSEILLIPGKRNLPKFGHRMRDFFAWLSGIWKIVTTQINILAPKATGVTFKTKL